MGKYIDTRTLEHTYTLPEHIIFIRRLLAMKGRHYKLSCTVYLKGRAQKLNGRADVSERDGAVTEEHVEGGGSGGDEAGTEGGGWSRLLSCETLKMLITLFFHSLSAKQATVQKTSYRVPQTSQCKQEMTHKLCANRRK